VHGSLTALQVRVLRLLASLNPRWTLTGGGALAGFHLAHRRTKDVALFFHGLAALERLPEESAAALRADGMSVDFVQRAHAFCRLRAELGGEVVLVDLVAESVPNVFPVERRLVDATEILVDSRAEIQARRSLFALGDPRPGRREGARRCRGGSGRRARSGQQEGWRLLAS
jgi:hypothetical protein